MIRMIKSQVKKYRTDQKSKDKDGNQNACEHNLTSNTEARLYIVRHAEHVEPSLPTLSRKGSLQATAIAKTLKRQGKFVSIYSSTRCKETAEIIGNTIGVKVQYDDRLRNWDGGVLTGLTIDEIKTQYPEFYKKRYQERRPDFKVPEGESLLERYERVKEVLTEISSQSFGKNVILVTHGGVIDDMYRFTCNFPLPQLTNLLKPYGCLSLLSKPKDGAWRDEQWAGVHHLPQVVAESPTGGHLYLFPHQVAGSFPMFRGDRGELCKPATKVELQAYERVTKLYPQMSEFVPVYLGTIDINVKHILSDRYSLSQPLHQIPEPLHQLPKSNTVGHHEHTVVHNNSDGLVVAPDGMVIESVPLERKANPEERESTLKSIENCNDISNNPPTDISNGTNGIQSESEGQGSTSGVCGKIKRTISKTLVKRVSNGPKVPDQIIEKDFVPAGKQPFSVTNLWARFTEDRWKKVVKSEKGDGFYVYLILENLSHGVRRPHILDLKIGTRQHGPNESEAKKKRKEARCATTTSRTMGIRLAGMQKFIKDEQRYLLKDKYWGRSLDDDGLKTALDDFVHDGDKVRVNVVREIIRQIEGMLVAVKTTRWRYFGSSILIIYDDADTLDPKMDDSENDSAEVCEAIHRKRSRSFSSTDTSDRVSVRLIDFSHCDQDESNYDTHDEGLVFGLENLLQIYTSLLKTAEVKQKKKFDFYSMASNRIYKATKDSLSFTGLCT